MNWSYCVVTKLLKDAKEVPLKKEQQKNTVYSLISGGNIPGQKKQHASHIFFHFLCIRNLRDVSTRQSPQQSTSLFLQLIFRSKNALSFSAL